jgi:hypothetical protein
MPSQVVKTIAAPLITVGTQPFGAPSRACDADSRLTPGASAVRTMAGAMAASHARGRRPSGFTPGPAV